MGKRDRERQQAERAIAYAERKALVLSMQSLHDSIVALYRYFTGNLTLSEDQEYWSACGDQTAVYAEIVHLTESRFLSPSQFVGVVNRRPDLAKKNRAVHPDAEWVEEEWDDGLLRRLRRAGIVHMQTRWDCDSRYVLEALARTMPYCVENTVLILTAMRQTSSSDRWIDPDPELLPRVLPMLISLSELDRWDCSVETIEHGVNLEGMNFIWERMISYVLHAKTAMESEQAFRRGRRRLPGSVSTYKRMKLKMLSHSRAERAKKAIYDPGEW